MYKIMLADDEGIVIDALKFVIEKEFGDECEIAFAKTGRSVIELAESFRPDIAIMDIMMPGINGIEAMKEIRKNNSKMVLIVMSAYDKFDYAKESISLGVLEYINKPMEKTKIISVLKKAMSEIDAMRIQRTNDLIIKEKLEIVVPIIESGLIYSILFHERFTEDFDSYRTVLGITSNNGYIVSLISGESQEGTHMTNAIGSSVKMQKYYKEINEELKKTFNCIVGPIMANRIVVLVPCDSDTLSYEERISIIEKSRDLIRVLRAKTDTDYRIAIGSVRPLIDLRLSYSETINALSMATDSVVHVDDLPMQLEYESNYPKELEKKLFDEVREGNTTKVISSSGAFFDWMVSNPTTGIMDVKLKVIEFVLWAEKIAYRSGGMKYEFDSRSNYLPEVMGATDYATLRNWFVDKMATACRNMVEKKVEKSTKVIDAAKEYILKNYNRDISLDDVSREVNISPYYFSKLFKDDTGAGFIEYLTNIRIEKAKELISGTEYSMKEICQMVGYTDPNYFSRSFKKKVGVTPTEYKENGNDA